MKHFFTILFIAIYLISLTSCGKHNVKNALSVQADYNVMGKDDRVKVNFRKYTFDPYKMILKTSSGCSSALIGEDLILTAAHCVSKLVKLDGSGDFEYPMVFYSEYENGTYKDYAVGLYARYGTLKALKEGHLDWAVVKIDKKLGKKYGYFGLAPYNHDNYDYSNDLTLAGYSTDIESGKQMSTHFLCSIREVDSNRGMLYHDCDLSYGSSGGPLFKCNTENECLIVGVQHGQQFIGTDKVYYNKYRFENANKAVSIENFIDVVIDEKNKSF